MNKKVLIIISVIAILIGIFLIKKVYKNSNKIRNNSNGNNMDQIEIQFDEETGLYYVVNQNKNEIRAASKNPTELEIYIQQPDLVIDPLEYHTNINDFSKDDKEEIEKQ